ncbi:hypothetical protein IW261DRAFT_1451009 [Armillaria novae-zelandiae]|uniref:Uncharacterized protein n=1 Tax=Armillaria novae-zelandiae TaxID=153914 RepID=A0AA39ULI6_9AGAR|nr:hypothetical protein IW261DRAFT_1451009 [Armillaria novae-zelandiae]
MNSQSDVPVLDDNDFMMYSASQDMQCEVLGLEDGNEFAVAFDARVRLLQSQSRNVSMIHIDEGISLKEAHGDVFGGPLRTPINSEFKLDGIATACVQNASNAPANNETIFIERMQSNIASLPREIGRLLEGTLRNIEERGTRLAARLGCIERKMEDLQKAVSADLQDVCNDIRDTERLVQLDACQIQQIRQMCANVYTTGQSNLQASRNSKSTISSKGNVPASSPLPSNEEAVDFPEPEVPEIVTVMPRQARMDAVSAMTKTRGKTARNIMERSKERSANEENAAAEPGRYPEAAANKKINGGKAVKTRSRGARAAPY